MDLELHRIIAFQDRANETLRLSVEALAHENEKLKLSVEALASENARLRGMLERLLEDAVPHYDNNRELFRVKFSFVGYGYHEVPDNQADVLDKLAKIYLQLKES